jgi:hypothetical protein
VRQAGGKAVELVRDSHLLAARSRTVRLSCRDSLIR